MLSRRHFLQLSGIALASVSLPSLTGIASTPASTLAFETVYGRAFGVTRVYREPSAAAPIVTRLWADTVTPILSTHEEWYRIADGYVLREHLQPMIAPARQSEMPVRPPFWAEVSGAVGIVQRSCAAEQYPVARIGHGGILRVIDWLPGDGVDWYGVAEREDGDLLGWTQSAAWSPIQIETAAPTLSLVVDGGTQRMSVYEGEQVLLTAPISSGGDLLGGIYPISKREMAHSDQHSGTPWVLDFGGDLKLSGVYWHNRFGRTTSGEAIQVTPALARWLYPRAREVIIS